MERLTFYDGCGNPELCCCMECGGGCGNDNENCGYCEKPYEAYARLAAYEDLGPVEELAVLVKVLKEERIALRAENDALRKEISKRCTIQKSQHGANHLL